MAGFVKRSSIFSSKPAPKIEIKPDHDYLLIEGSPNETRDTTISLTGKVVISTNEPISISKNGIRVIFQGIQRITHSFRSFGLPGPVPHRIMNTEHFIKKEVELKDPTTGASVKRIASGIVEYPYSFELPGDISESIEGLIGQFVEYNLKAYADRPLLAAKLEAKRHLRIVRTLGETNQSELLDRQETVGGWEGKCSYKFGATSRAAIFGDYIRVDFSLTPFHPKLIVGKIEMMLAEEVKTKTTRPSPEHYPQYPDMQGGWWVHDPEYFPVQEFECPAESRRFDPEIQMDVYETSFKFTLPSNLNECRQDVVQHPNIRIRHLLHYRIQLTNPEGNTSEVRAQHPVRIFISRHLPIGEGNAVHRDTNFLANPENPTLLESLQEAPPTYDHHRLDAVFGDVEFAGYQTPAVSSSRQSMTPATLSRRASADDMATAHAEVSTHADDLTHRLHNLRGLGTPPRTANNPREGESAEQSHSTSPSGSTVVPPGLSRSGSTVSQAPGGHFDGASGSALPGSGSYNMAALERITSYNTAVRTPVHTPAQEEPPPSYEDATSRPPSPVHSRGPSGSREQGN